MNESDVLKQKMFFQCKRNFILKINAKLFNVYYYYYYYYKIFLKNKIKATKFSCVLWGKVKLNLIFIEFKCVAKNKYLVYNALNLKSS